jgi:glycerol-3-phosphate dehydrogenase
VAYFDAQALDSRLALETALSARRAGAQVLNYHPVTQARLAGGVYRLEGTATRTGEPWTLAARAVVNATGPWVPQFERRTMGHQAHSLIYDRGIHFVIPGLGLPYGLALMGADRRLVFVLPWRDKYSLIGTTESRYEGEDFAAISPSEEEIRYLLETFNQFFPGRDLKREEVLHIYSGVRTLMTGGKSLSRLSRESEIVIESDAPGTAWVLLYGGKLTSYRSYAVNIVRRLRKHVAPSEADRSLDTAVEPLPGGGAEPERFRIPQGIAQEQVALWRKRYGSRWTELVRRVDRHPAAGEALVPSHRFTQADLEYMIEEELAYRLEDLILRRTKMIYDMTDAERSRLQAALAATLARTPAPLRGIAQAG